MNKKTISRKEFFQFFNKGLDSASEKNKNNDVNNTGLSDEKLEFLKKYVEWLKNFKLLVQQKNNDSFDVKHNKKIMDLAAEIESKKNTLEKYMEDPIFSAHFTHLTKDISDLI